MISLSEYREYCNSLSALIGADRLLMVVQEEHLKKKLRDDAGVVLAAVYPSTVGVGKEDCVVDVNTVLLYVLRYSGKSGMTDEKEAEAYELLQGLTEGIKDRIIRDADSGLVIMAGLDRESIVIEPEWNVAGAYIGYSIAFSFEK